MRDPYLTLGVSKSATAEEIKSAYRKLAKKLHPDVNPGKKDIEQKFKDVTAAYDLLSDKDKRAKFDRGEVDEQGNDRGFGGFGGGFGGDNPFSGANTWRSRARKGAGGGGDPFSGGFGGSMEDILNEFMGGGRGGAKEPLRGNDVTYSLAVPFLEAALGGKRRVTLQSGKTIDVTIPPGTTEGNKLRLRGLGQPSSGGAGDAIVEMHVEPHAYFTRNGNDISLEAPISLPEAVLGGSIKVPTLEGHVSVKVPKGANSGTSLRLKGKGVPHGKDLRGDMFVKLRIVMPDTVPDDLTDYIEKWAKKNSYDPRKKLGWD
ncbi:MAG TPA: J domain-containing protein [Alphaproteobacteria bacterium]|nr:J domain-containing protein [Alphaproteobacteria bacterium]